MKRKIRCKDIVRLVPRALIQEGIDLCKKNIADYLQDTRIIASGGKPYHAVISAEFGGEELGKISLLKETIANDTKDLVAINGEEFCSHDKKAERAWAILDRKYQVLFDEGVWKRGIWESRIWVENTEISPETRCECAFVDFINGRWTLGRNIKGNLLQEFIAHFEEKLKNV